jgi:hypothetical protein
MMTIKSKYADLEFACGLAEDRVIRAERETKSHLEQVEHMKVRLSKLQPGTKAYLDYESEYQDALDDQRNLECYVELIRKERDRLRAELRRAINE